MNKRERPDWNQPVTLGRTGLSVGRLGVASSFGVPADALEMAFERGVNYLYWGSIPRERFAIGIRRLMRSAGREKLVICLQTYTRIAALVAPSIKLDLFRLGADHADVLLLGWFNDPPSRSILDAAHDLVRRGLVRHLAISSHRRTVFPELERDRAYGIYHFRYNAGHRGAEKEIFPHVPADSSGPGMVSYTATRWASLLRPSAMPPGERTPTAADCYRFVLTNPSVHVCMTGPRNRADMEHALTALDRGPMDADEIAWISRVGDHVAGRGLKVLDGAGPQRRVA
jgi:aryl-alcohol dehydrogenase-like predicted oxidoreductase